MQSIPRPNSIDWVKKLDGATSDAPLAVIIPVRPSEDYNIAIASLTDAADKDLIREVIVVGGSSPSEQRNYAASIASAPYIYFLDNDSAVSGAALSVGLQCFNNPAIAAVGGPALAFCDASFFQQACDAVLGSYFGTFLTRARHVKIGPPRLCVNEELILCNLMIRRDIFLKHGGFRRDLFPNEENELLKRISADNYKFFYHPDLNVSRPRRATLKTFLQQSMSYGYGRARHIRHGFRLLDIAFLLPSLFILYLGLLCFVRSLTAAVPLLLYLLIVVGVSLRRALSRNSLRLGLAMLALFPLLHISYGVGLFHGLITLKRASQRKQSTEFTNSDGSCPITSALQS